MLVGLRVVAWPWRVLRKVWTLPRTLVSQLRQMVDLQFATNVEVRELHQSSLLAAIHLIEEQRRDRGELARDYARLERRLESLERQLAAIGAGTEPTPERTAGG